MPRPGKQPNHPDKMTRPPRQQYERLQSPASHEAPKQQQDSIVPSSPAAYPSSSDISAARPDDHDHHQLHNNGCSQSTTIGDDSLDHENNEELQTEPSLPPPFSSPSAASSTASSNRKPILSRSRTRRSPTSLRDELTRPSTPHARTDLMGRLVDLAQRLRLGDNTGLDLYAVAAQLDRWESAANGRRSADMRPHRSLDGSSPGNSSSLLSSIGSPPIRSHFSDLTASIQREQQKKREQDDETQRVSRGMTSVLARKVVAETEKLNDELASILSNLRVRQEESDHIHALIERAERATQRIIFLQNCVAYLENELQENDTDLQHLRICLKAVEVQLPPHPDQDLQRCIATIHREYQALKRKRANRSSQTTITDLDVDSPAR